MIVGITGHRPDKLGGYDNHRFHHNVQAAITAAILDLNPSMGITGMAQGADTLFAYSCSLIGIPYIAAIPFKGQELVWPEDAQITYRSLVSAATSAIVVCEGGYAPWKLQKRNEWIVDSSDILLAVWDGTEKGGTYNCIEYAKKKSKENLRIPIYYIPIFRENGELKVGSCELR